MNKFYISTLILFLFFYNPYFAQDSTIVGPGVVYYHDEIIEGGPWNFDILKIDLTNPFLHIESVKANDNLFSFERMSSASKRYDKEGHKVIGAINGDFYNTSTGEPTNIQIVNGQVIYKPIDRVVFALDEFNNPLIDIFNYSAQLILDDNSYSIPNLNQTFSSSSLNLFNSFYGSVSRTPSGTKEITFQPINNWMINDTMMCIVTKSDSTGNTSLPKGFSVISGNKTIAPYLGSVQVGDTIKLLVKVNPSVTKLTQAVGGNVRLVTNGVVNNDNGDRHPRTAVGFSQDSLTLYFVTVDGRQAGWSVGMSYYELGSYMKNKWNVYQGINLDGGGSTTIVVRGEVKNRPSDSGGERSVANGLLLISSAPTGPLAHVLISPRNLYLIKGGSAKFSAKAYDEYYNPLTISGTLNWGCDSKLGTIDATGNLTTTAVSENGYVYVQLDTIKDSVLVLISSVTKIDLTPDPVVLQVGQTQQMTAKAYDAYGNVVQISTNGYAWSVEGNVGSINTTGLFTAENTGEGKIIVKYEDASDTVEVKIGVEQYFILDDYSGGRTYTLSGTKIDLTACAFTIDHSKYVSIPSSGRLDYSLTTGGTSTLNMTSDIPISGTPEAIGVNVYGDGKGHWLRCELKDKNNNKFLLDLTPATPGIDWTNEWKYLEVELANAIASWANPSAVLTFPISITKIYLAETSDTKKDQGSIYFDDLKVHFIATDVENEQGKIVPDKYDLKQNYPNPFNPNTLIEYSVAKTSNIELSVYNVLGEKLDMLINKEHSPGNYKIEWNAGKYSSGIYICKLSAGDISLSRKMQLIK
ncbi:MAG: T9SS C-terminal target domain-containing protein [Ignavibacteriales bacterium]|nr:MAG: T9SS C-terminal target domain-containing protein [Ignavibacteriales bacterium]